MGIFTFVTCFDSENEVKEISAQHISSFSEKQKPKKKEKMLVWQDILMTKH